MRGNNDGWQYSVGATDVVKHDKNGRYSEEIAWSDFTSSAQQALSPASLALCQTVSLDDPATYIRINPVTCKDRKRVSPRFLCSHFAGAGGR